MPNAPMPISGKNPGQAGTPDTYSMTMVPISATIIAGTPIITQMLQAAALRQSYRRIWSHPNGFRRSDAEWLMWKRFLGHLWAPAFVKCHNGHLAEGGQYRGAKSAIPRQSRSQQSPQQRGHGACMPHLIQAQRPQRRLVVGDPESNLLPDTQNNDSRDSAVITTLVDVTKLAALRATLAPGWPPPTPGRGHRAQPHDPLSIDGAPEASPVVDRDPGLWIRRRLLPTRRWSDPPRCQQNPAAFCIPGGNSHQARDPPAVY